ncbi:uncharacterized protein LOC101782568 [Setaria italica]|uniref:uncharacterized protein LOC101782568 n=1 Tax=Setaria italica TaxID=4555 RepID=UPI000646A621|nr:uncharacterized protein LOC101782568 [Setaria italica]
MLVKKNGSWCMYVDYTSLNKVCPKLPPDRDEGITPADDLFHHSVWRVLLCHDAVGLKNTGSTYHRCINHCLDHLVRDIVEVYIDDIIVKSRKTEQLITNLRDTFECLRHYNIKLNLEKCAFEVPKGKLLGFIVSERGIEANPEKITTIRNLGPITNLKGTQKLIGCLASLSRFMQRLGERGMPLYKLLKKFVQFHWNKEAQEAFTKLQASFASPPTLVSPTLEEPLLLYIAATTQVVSATLIVEREEPEHALNVQRSVYFIREVLSYMKLDEKFDDLKLHHVLSHDNLTTDFLAKLVSNREHAPLGVFDNDAHELLIKLAKAPTPALDASHPEPAAELAAGAKMGAPNLKVVALEPSWTMPFLNYLLRDTLPTDANKARRLVRHMKASMVDWEELYKCSPSGILQKSIPTDQGRELLLKKHVGICGYHAAPSSDKASTGPWWWQTPSRSFAPAKVWGLDLIGPFKRVPGDYTHLLIAADKFTKWIKVKPITKFMRRKFLRFYDEYHIRVDLALVSYPRTNGQVKRTNGMVLQGLKPRIFDGLKKFAGRWTREVPAVLWSLRMTPNRSTGFTPFFVVYGAEAALPTNLDYGAPRVKAYDESRSEEARQDALDQLDETRDVVLLQSAKYQQALRRYHSMNVRGCAFQVIELVLRRVQTSHGKHKLTPP